MPGLANIRDITELIKKSKEIASTGVALDTLRVLPLHSTLTSAEQSRVFTVRMCCTVHLVLTLNHGFVVMVDTIGHRGLFNCSCSYTFSCPLPLSSFPHTTHSSSVPLSYSPLNPLSYSILFSSPLPTPSLSPRTTPSLSPHTTTSLVPHTTPHRYTPQECVR